MVKYRKNTIEDIFLSANHVILTYWSFKIVENPAEEEKFWMTNHSTIQSTHLSSLVDLDKGKNFS